MTVQWVGPLWLQRPAEAVGMGVMCQRATKLSLHGPIYDDRAVEHLLKLRRLESLTLANTKMSLAAVARLRQALPDCRISTW